MAEHQEGPAFRGGEQRVEQAGALVLLTGSGGGGGGSDGGQAAFDETLEGRLRQGAHHAVLDLAVLEDQEGGIDCTSKRLAVSMLASMSSLAICDLAVHLGGELLEHRRHRAAGAAPGRPEVDQHRGARLDRLLETRSRRG